MADPVYKTWRERLLETEDIKTLVLDSAYWSTCAVGEQHTQYPEVVFIKLVDEAPTDSILESLGNRFHTIIKAGDRKWALHILDLIEDRVLEMKREKL